MRPCAATGSLILRCLSCAAAALIMFAIAALAFGSAVISPPSIPGPSVPLHSFPATLNSVRFLFVGPSVVDGSRLNVGRADAVVAPPLPSLSFDPESALDGRLMTLELRAIPIIVCGGTIGLLDALELLNRPPPVEERSTPPDVPGLFRGWRLRVGALRARTACS